MRSQRWWVFDRPLGRDWLFVVGLALGALALIETVLRRADFGGAVFVITVLLAIPSGVMAAGVFGGTLREFFRGRRGRGG